MSIIVFFIYYLAQPIHTSKVLYIPSGSISAIITHLQDKNIPLTTLDKTFLRFFGKPQQGWILMGAKQMTHADFLYKLTHAKAAMTQITLIPGETTYGFSVQLAKELNLDAKQLYKAFSMLGHYKEGALVPDTYKLPIGIEEKALAVYLLRSSSLRHNAWAKKIFGQYHKKKWEQYLIMASVIQKEAANKGEMPLVSSVIHNRLNKGMKLQMDGTLNYGKYSHQKVSAKRIRNDKSHYNTYKYKGLPPLPVCNVELSAIKAAIFPAKTNYLYFMKGKKGTHDFSRYYSTHLGHIYRLKSVTK
nr:endolytic transglycosylase MltG [Sulfurimonas sp. MAG313]